MPRLAWQKMPRTQISRLQAKPRNHYGLSYGVVAADGPKVFSWENSFLNLMGPSQPFDATALAHYFPPRRNRRFASRSKIAVPCRPPLRFGLSGASGLRRCLSPAIEAAMVAGLET